MRTAKKLTIFPWQGAMFQLKLVMPAFGQGKFVRVHTAAK
jgi:hypothetical protein